MPFGFYLNLTHINVFVINKNKIIIMLTISSKEVIRKLEKDGWYLVCVNGSHYQYKHPTKSGRVTVKHPCKDYCIATIKSMEKQSGLKLL